MIRLEVVTLYQKVEPENKLDLTVFNEKADDSTLQALKADPEELEVYCRHGPYSAVPQKTEFGRRLIRAGCAGDA